MKFIIFSGTTEGRDISARLNAMGHDVTVSVATDYGRVKQGEGDVKILEGRMDEAQMENVIADYDLCIDATHPYAAEAGANIKKACERAGIRYMRLARAVSDIPDDSMIFADASKASEYLETTKGNVLLTTGAKEIGAFEKIERERLFVRILPSMLSLKAAEDAGVRPENIIAMEGPFSEEMNELLIREKQIKYLVTKDGGVKGGFPQKAGACEKTGAKLLLIDRPSGREGMNEEEIITEINNIENNKEIILSGKEGKS